MSRALVIQLARLGDLVQSLPAISALHALHPERPLDLLCPAPLVPLGELFTGISKVYPWDGALWRQDIGSPGTSWKEQFHLIHQVWTGQAYPAYPVAYNLNNHPRGILAAHIFAACVIGPGEWGPVNPRLSPWGKYLRKVAQDRGQNRIHLSDAFCGLCQVRPPIGSLEISHVTTPMPSGLECLGGLSGRQTIGLVLGAGDKERRIPGTIWKMLIQKCVAALPESWVVLIGGTGEREIALALESALPSWCLNRVINMCGRTSLLELVSVLRRCQWVVGSDTGPLHLSTLCGAQAVGWYFSRARVHETGPYGAGHYVWQHSQGDDRSSWNNTESLAAFELPQVWPVEETVRVMLGNTVCPSSGQWSLWASQHDMLGTFYQRVDLPEDMQQFRREVWEQLSSPLSIMAS